MSDDETKLCPHCGKKLRSDNTRGACSACLARGKKADGEPAPKRRSSTAAADTAQAAGTAVERFRQVASGLGLDPDTQLEAFAQAWLDELRAKVEAAA